MTLALERPRVPVLDRRLPIAPALPEPKRFEPRVIQARSDTAVLDRAAREQALRFPSSRKTRADVKRDPDDPAHAVRRREAEVRAERVREWAARQSGHEWRLHKDYLAPLQPPSVQEKVMSVGAPAWYEQRHKRQLDALRAAGPLRVVSDAVEPQLSSPLVQLASLVKTENK